VLVRRHVTVLAAVATVGVVAATPGWSSQRHAAQDTVSIAAPGSVPANTRFIVFVTYTLTDLQPTTLFVGLQPAAAGGCPASPFDAISGQNRF
jgi:hypothetical protein